MYDRAYFKTLGYSSGKIEERFDQSDLAVVRDAESPLIDAANGKAL